jgi:hypothetical protein
VGYDRNHDSCFPLDVFFVHSGSMILIGSADLCALGVGLDALHGEKSSPNGADLK